MLSENLRLIYIANGKLPCHFPKCEVGYQQELHAWSLMTYLLSSGLTRQFPRLSERHKWNAKLQSQWGSKYESSGLKAFRNASVST